MRPQILHTRLFREKFTKCLALLPRELWVAAPYVGKAPPYGSVARLADFLFHRECEKFVLVTLPPQPENKPPQRDGGSISSPEADLIAGKGVDLLIRPGLHSKVYQFLFPGGDRAAFVGSANFTAGGFERNDETVAFFREKADNDAVAREFERLVGFGAQEYAYWKTLQGIKNWRPSC